MSRLDELKVLDTFLSLVITHEYRTLTITLGEAEVIAKHLLRLLAHDRQRAEQTRRAKIARTLKGIKRGHTHHP